MCDRFYVCRLITAQVKKGLVSTIGPLHWSFTNLDQTCWQDFFNNIWQRRKSNEPATWESVKPCNTKKPAVWQMQQGWLTKFWASWVCTLSPEGAIVPWYTKFVLRMVPHPPLCHGVPYHQPVYPLVTFLYSLCSNIKPPGCGSLVPLISARMGLLVLLAASLAGVHGFGLGPSLEWKAGDAEMWGQVKTVQVLRSYHPLLWKFKLWF